MTFYGRVERGQIKVDAKAFALQIGQLEGKPIELILRRERRRRDPQQNYYWGVVLKAFAEALKRDPQDVHEALRREFLPAEHFRGLTFAVSTAEIDKVQFSRYLDRVLSLAAELGIAIAEPVPEFVRSA